MTVINNFFSRAGLDYYTKPQGLEKEPKLPPKLAGPLHKLIMSTNLHPVKVGPAALHMEAWLSLVLIQILIELNQHILYIQIPPVDN